MTQYNFSDIPRDCYRAIKRFIQRGKRGWSDEDTWSIDMYLSPIIKDMVVYLRNNGYGHPASLTQNKWNKILDEIVWTFGIAEKISNDYLELTPEEEKRYKKGWRLFQKYYFHLWS